MDATFRDPALEEFDTTRLLANAREQAAKRRYEDFCIVDVDAHHYETDSYAEITEYIEDPVLRHEARIPGLGPAAASRTPDGNYQEMGGRIARISRRGATRRSPPDTQRDITLTQRWMDAMGIDIICLFPTPMLALGLTPRLEVEVALARAYNRWLTEKMLAAGAAHQLDALSARSTIPSGCIKMVEEFADKKGVIGFMVTAPRHRGVLRQCYMQDSTRCSRSAACRLAFHGGFSWAASRTSSCATASSSVHALGFTFFNMLHLTNWVDERHARAVPQAQGDLDRERARLGPVPDAAARQRIHDAHAPRCRGLKRKPSDYMREMYFTTQPMEMVDNREALELTFKMHQRRDAAPLFVGLSALGHGSAEHDLRSAVPQRAGQAQHPRRQRAAACSISSRPSRRRSCSAAPRGRRRSRPARHADAADGSGGRGGGRRGLADFPAPSAGPRRREGDAHHAVRLRCRLHRSDERLFGRAFRQGGARRQGAGRRRHGAAHPAGDRRPGRISAGFLASISSAPLAPRTRRSRRFATMRQNSGFHVVSLKEKPVQIRRRPQGQDDRPLVLRRHDADLHRSAAGEIRHRQGRVEARS